MGDSHLLSFLGLLAGPPGRKNKHLDHHVTFHTQSARAFCLPRTQAPEQGNTVVAHTPSFHTPELGLWKLNNNPTGTVLP